MHVPTHVFLHRPVNFNVHMHVFVHARRLRPIGNTQKALRLLNDVYTRLSTLAHLCACQSQVEGCISSTVMYVKP